MTKQNENVPIMIGLIVITLASASSAALMVRTQETVLSACYVPNVGVIYRIKAEGLPDACTEATHVEFGWNMEGPVGPAGTDGAAGTDGVSGYEIVSNSVTVPAAVPGFGSLDVTVPCPSGKVVLGGGVNTGDELRNIHAHNSYPAADSSGWTFTSITSGYSTPKVIVVYALCVKVT